MQKRFWNFHVLLKKESRRKRFNRISETFLCFRIVSVQTFILGMETGHYAQF